MAKDEKKPKSFFDKFKRDQGVGARQSVLEDIFNDYYDDRRNIYKVNFIRGIFLGAGSALGGTVILALIVWILSLFVNIPIIGDQAQQAQNTIESSQQKR